MHIRRRSASVRVLLGEEVEWVEWLEAVVDIGVELGAVGTVGGLRVDWLVNILGHCGIIKGCSC
jgi:hypothetical protein